jgi:hypothetical protein
MRQLNAFRRRRAGPIDTAAMLTAVIWCGGMGAASAQIAPRSGCADCHVADRRAPHRDHLQAWDLSPHRRADVGCDKCHGGNPGTFERVIAHSGVLASSDARSPVNRANLPTTCGACHVGPLVAFQSSRHSELLKSADARGPTCSTCHGTVDGRLLSPKALAAECDSCHGPGESAPRAGRARQVREQYERLQIVRDQMKQADALIKRVDDKSRRDSLRQTSQRAHDHLARAIDAGHRFVYDQLRDSLGLAETQTTALLARLVNR